MNLDKLLALAETFEEELKEEQTYIYDKEPQLNNLVALSEKFLSLVKVS